MNIAVAGIGYVGLVTGTCFAEMGNNVFCVDVDEQKIRQLETGIVPIYEPGLEEMVLRNVKAGRLHFTTDLTTILNEVEVIFSAVGTPPDEDGSADLNYVLQVARTVGQNMQKYLLIVNKSTVPVGTAALVKQTIAEELAHRNVDIEYDVASNPEFLKEGSAVKDFMSPDRVVVGVESKHAEEVLTQLYKPFMLNNLRIIFMDVLSAEMTKYAANAMLATRISFMNDMANLCERCGADINMVRKGIGSDPRIGNKFIYPGIGYGGSCFPKDIKALMKTADKKGYQMRVLQAVDAVNEDQKKVLFLKLHQYYNGNLQGKTIALWGLAFKPETDDMRFAPSLVLTQLLLDAGCKVKVYDPVATTEAKRIFKDTVIYADDMYAAATNADALMLLTEWKQFRMPNWETIKQIMKHSVIFDGRNIYDQKLLKQHGFVYQGIGTT
ncbi:MAG: UDP-glucose/GDP-mannose dehydrogenase family protein [Bacteroidales bacterium]|nr:UDP-glucose/GDP-mannose dehydrogenase family protein [Bacteroidales bacterium]